MRSSIDACRSWLWSRNRHDRLRCCCGLLQVLLVVLLSCSVQFSAAARGGTRRNASLLSAALVGLLCGRRSRRLCGGRVLVLGFGQFLGGGVRLVKAYHNGQVPETLINHGSMHGG